MLCSFRILRKPCCPWKRWNNLKGWCAINRLPLLQSDGVFCKKTYSASMHRNPEHGNAYNTVDLVKSFLLFESIYTVKKNNGCLLHVTQNAALNQVSLQDHSGWAMIAGNFPLTSLECICLADICRHSDQGDDSPQLQPCRTRRGFSWILRSKVNNANVGIVINSRMHVSISTNHIIILAFTVRSQQILPVAELNELVLGGILQHDACSTQLIGFLWSQTLTSR